MKKKARTRATKPRPKASWVAHYTDRMIWILRTSAFTIYLREYDRGSSKPPFFTVDVLGFTHFIRTTNVAIAKKVAITFTSNRLAEIAESSVDLDGVDPHGE